MGIINSFIVFLLFLIPGTPKDILSYAVGLTDLSLISWIFITSVGRFPSILLSALSGDAILGQRYDHLIVILVVFAVTAAAGAVMYRKWAGQKEDR